MSEIKKVPMTGKERSKKFYDENKEKERLMELFAESSRDLPDHENHDDHTQGKNKT